MGTNSWWRRLALVKERNKRVRRPCGELLFDGTHGVLVSSSIRVRDQDKAPAAPDVKRVVRQLASQPGTTKNNEEKEVTSRTRTALFQSALMTGTSWLVAVSEVRVCQHGRLRGCQRESGDCYRQWGTPCLGTRACCLAPPVG